MIDDILGVGGVLDSKIIFAGGVGEDLLYLIDTVCLVNKRKVTCTGIREWVIEKYDAVSVPYKLFSIVWYRAYHKG